METVDLNVELRESLGSSFSKKLRRNGKVPAVVYSGGKWSQPLTIDLHHFERATSGKLPSQIYTLRCDSSDLNEKSAIVKDIEIEPLKQRIKHVDLQAIEEGQTVSVCVPLELTGTSAAVTSGNALLNQTAYEVEIECLPKEIPQKLTLDISEMIAGSSMHAGSIPLPDNTILKSDRRLVVVNVIGKRGEKKAAGTEEAPAE